MINPYPWFAAWTRTTTASMVLAYHAQSVIALRMMGMAGLVRSPKGEGMRMVTEKPPAFLAAGLAWQKAVLNGRGFPAQADAITRPLARKARANHRRLRRH